MKTEENTKQEQGSQKKKSNASLFLLGILVVLLIVLAGLFAVYTKALKNLSENETVLSVAGALKSPVVTVNNEKILYTDYVKDLQTLRRFYEQSGDEVPPVSEESISDQAISRLVINEIVAAQAEKFGASISDEELENTKTDLVSSTFNGDKSLADAEMTKQFGWDLDTYAEKVIRNILLEQKLQEVFMNKEGIEDLIGEKFLTEEIRARHILFQVKEGDSADEVKENAQAVLERIKGGEDFATLAKEFGSDGTKDAGGDLGWFTRGRMVPEFEQAVFALEDGALGQELVQTQFGFHIMQRQETRGTRDFLGYMNDQLMNADIRFRLPIHDPFEAILNGQVSPQPVSVGQPVPSGAEGGN